MMAAHPLLKTVHKQTAKGDMTPLQGQAAAHALGGDPSRIPVPCEAPGCARVLPLTDMHSIQLQYATFPAPQDHAAPYQCVNLQHFGCSHEHAVEATIACLRGGHLPAPADVIAARQAAVEAAATAERP